MDDGLHEFRDSHWRFPWEAILVAILTNYINAFRSYADFGGRATRTEYWLFQVLNAVINYGLLFIAWRNDWSMGVLVVLILYSLV